MIADSNEPWVRTLLPAEASLQDAIRSLDQTGLQITLVVARDGTLIGTVTDGDIRRGLLRGLELTSPVDSIVQREPFVVPQTLGREQALQLMQAKLRTMRIYDGPTEVHKWVVARNLLGTRR